MSEISVQVELPADVSASEWRAAMDRLPAQWSTVRHPGLAVWLGADAGWRLPDTELKPLSQIGVPRSSREVSAAIEQVAAALEALHAQGVGAFDLSPRRVYADEALGRCVVLPSPWLATTESETAGGPWVAPEVGAGEADPVRADVYALGTLAWYLLTGETRPEDVTLLSEVRPALGAWDELIDGCCRSRPGRRFANLRSVTAALPAPAGAPAAGPAVEHPSVGTPPPPMPDPGPPGTPLWKRPAVLGALGVAALLAVGLVAFSAMGPGGGAEGGWAGAAVQYADRGYEGASWEKLHVAANLGNLPVVGGRTAELQRITGIDEQNLWIADEKGVVFRLSNGHWEVAANRPDATDPLVGLVGRQTLLLGGGYYSQDHLYLVEPGGVRTVSYPKGLQRLRPNQTVTPIAPGLSYIHTYRETYKLLEGDLTRSTPGTGKDAIVVDTDGAPVNVNNSIMTPNHFRYSTSFSPGETYTVWMFRNRGARLIEYRDGAWVMLEEIALTRSDIDSITSAWISKDGDGRVFIVFGGPGAALRYRQGEGVVRFPLSTAPGATPAKLIAVWGAGPGTFWVMDASGSVWERRDQRWRAVVRGMADDEVVFADAWVSPGGTVFAVSHDALYRLNRP